MPKCKRRFRVGLCAAVIASGTFAAAAAVAATIEGDDGPNRLIGTQTRTRSSARRERPRPRARRRRQRRSAARATTACARASGNDNVNGLAGLDRISGAAGNDTLQGWAGRDRLFGGFGDDTLIGDVPRRATGSAATGCGAATATTSCAAVTGATCCAAAPDNDTDLGQGGGDFMARRPRQRHPGRRRRQRPIFANIGRDTTHGGPGNDHLWALIKPDVAGPGDLEGDIVRGDDGNDLIRTRDGEHDIVSCGPGFDKAILDMST